MPRTFGSFTDLLHKLNAYQIPPFNWDGKLCIRTRIDDENHQPTTHYYTRIFNHARSNTTGKLELDIPNEQAIGEPRSITFEDLRNEKFSIAIAGSGVGYDCSNIHESFWWYYEDETIVNSKGGRKKTRRKRGGTGKVFSSLQQLYDKLLDKTDQQNRIFFKIGNGEVESGLLIQQVSLLEYLPVLKDDLTPKLLNWQHLKGGVIKVKANLDEDWWQYYEEGAKGGRKKTRRKKGKGGVFSRRRRVIPTERKKPMVSMSKIVPFTGDEQDILNQIELYQGQIDTDLQSWHSSGRPENPFWDVSPRFSQLLEKVKELKQQLKNLRDNEDYVPKAKEPIYAKVLKGGRRKNKTRKCKNKWTVSTNFDAGNIIKKRCETIDNINIYTLEIKKDPYPKFTRKKYQNWYYFQVNNVKGKKCKFIIENLVNIDNDWKGHKVVYTYDHKCFYRHSTTLNEKQNYITWNFTPKKNKIWFSYYVPYSRDRVYKLNKKISNRNDVSKIILGKTSLNNKIELLRFGKGLKHIFIIARQHPGETIGSWMLEGFLKALFYSKFTNQTKKLLETFTFHVIPMVNPDGVQLGHWYTQKHGHNCNRQWMKKKCPEIKLIDKYMKQYEGCLYFDFHGDEGCKKHFFTTCDRTKKKKDGVWDFFRKRMKHYSKNFDKEDYYKKAAHNVHGTFDCAWENALTLEGCMKHDYKKECVSLEPLRIGKNLYKCIYDWSFLV